MVLVGLGACGCGSCGDVYLRHGVAAGGTVDFGVRLEVLRCDGQFCACLSSAVQIFIGSDGIRWAFLGTRDCEDDELGSLSLADARRTPFGLAFAWLVGVTRLMLGVLPPYRLPGLGLSPITLESCSMCSAWCVHDFGRSRYRLVTVCILWLEVTAVFRMSVHCCYCRLAYVADCGISGGVSVWVSLVDVIRLWGVACVCLGELAVYVPVLQAMPLVLTVCVMLAMIGRWRLDFSSVRVTLELGEHWSCYGAFSLCVWH